MKIFSDKPKTQILLILTFAFAVKNLESSIFWMNNDSNLQNFKSPLEIIPRFNIQNGLNMNDDEIKKRVIKLGLRYRIEVDDEPVYVMILEMKARGYKMYYGIEYLPNKDGLLFDNGKTSFLRFFRKIKIFRNFNIFFIFIFYFYFFC